jgi:hypothetical protein
MIFDADAIAGVGFGDITSFAYYWISWPKQIDDQDVLVLSRKSV